MDTIKIADLSADKPLAQPRADGLLTDPAEIAAATDAARAALNPVPGRRLGDKPLPTPAIQKVWPLPTIDPEPSFVKAVAATIDSAVAAAMPGAIRAASIESEVIQTLMNAPAEITQTQHDFEYVDRQYQKRLFELTLEAYSAPMFPGKKEGEPLRPAANEAEREVAVGLKLSTDSEMVNLVMSRQAALRSLQENKHRFEAAQVIAKLLIAQTSHSNQ